MKKVVLFLILISFLIPLPASEYSWNSGEIGNDIKPSIDDGTAYASSDVVYDLSGLFNVTIGFSKKSWADGIEADTALSLTPDRESGTASGSTYLIWQIIAAPLPLKLILSVEGNLMLDGEATGGIAWYIAGDEDSYSVDLASDDDSRKSCEISIGMSQISEDIKLDISTADYMGLPAGDYHSSLKVNVSIS